MTSGEHTKGHTELPWRVMANDQGDPCIVTSEHEPWFIAEMSLGAGGSEVEDPAWVNANLIVTAVNTYPAVERLVKALEHIVGGIKCGGIVANDRLFDAKLQRNLETAEAALSRFRSLQNGCAV